MAVSELKTLVQSDGLLFCLHLRYRSDSDKTTALRLSRTTSPRIRSPWLAALAMFALSNNAGWTKKKIAEAMYSDTPSIVNLKRKIPVLIFYSTALASQSGVSFYPDIYAHDSALKLALTERSQTLALHKQKHIATNF